MWRPVRLLSRRAAKMIGRPAVDRSQTILYRRSLASTKLRFALDAVPLRTQASPLVHDDGSGPTEVGCSVYVDAVSHRRVRP
jgi:hypothetical protein